MLLETDPGIAREAARGFMAPYLGLPNYANALLRHGYDEADLADGGSDRLVDEIVAWGDEAAIADAVAAHRQAGADHVCVQVIRPEAALPVAEWTRLAPALIDAATP